MDSSFIINIVILTYNIFIIVPSNTLARYFFVTSKNLNFKADIKNKEILFLNNKLKKSYKTWNDKGYKKSFEKIIEDIVFDKKIKLPDYEFNLKVQKLISNIQNQR